MVLGTANDAINQLPTMKRIRSGELAGVHQASYGNTEAQAELFGGFIGAMGAGVFLILGVMVLLFRSFFKPVTILLALPLAAGGAFIALLLTGLDLTMPVLIGLLMLLGLAAKNSILLVEFAIEHERTGASRREAILTACRERARPIVMTTLAMMAGMLPTALGLGEGASFRQPMAVAVIGGLISSTALSLVLIPVAYELIDRFENWLTPRLGRLTTPGPPARPRESPRARRVGVQPPGERAARRPARLPAAPAPFSRRPLPAPRSGESGPPPSRTGRRPPAPPPWPATGRSRRADAPFPAASWPPCPPER